MRLNLKSKPRKAGEDDMARQVLYWSVNPGKQAFGFKRRGVVVKFTPQRLDEESNPVC